MYDLKEGKKRINEILSSKTTIKEENYVPANDSDYTYENGIRAWVGAIFVDIVGSSPIFEKANDYTARLIRAFSSELINIMRDCSHYRQIGIRGDCVYGIFDAGTKGKVKNLYELTIEINTFVKLLNKCLNENGKNPISVGIGFSIAEDLIVKAGVSRSGINDRVWIGKAVVTAAHLSEIASRKESNFSGPVIMNETAYENFIEAMINEKPDYKEWIKPIKINGILYYKSSVYYDGVDNL